MLPPFGRTRARTICTLKAASTMNQYTDWGSLCESQCTTQPHATAVLLRRRTPAYACLHVRDRVVTPNDPDSALADAWWNETSYPTAEFSR
jgi:hypothetical protein